MCGLGSVWMYGHQNERSRFRYCCIRKKLPTTFGSSFPSSFKNSSGNFGSLFENFGCCIAFIYDIESVYGQCAMI